ncbi:DNA binding protein [Vibrio phage CHOED]|uniref:DNA binding protein n=1 Tax=Vibrio phage CHOED TaxID=1458716 RepID=UPI00042ED1A6|nr:DNA binding protein [Vibrio phage CHOED]AHK11934.1 hypothetical protein CHOED_074 [Vibrio phage CHOED]
MNIFYLHDNPTMCAMLMNDQHVVKMIVETKQLLSAAHWELDGFCKAYKRTHVNHPSAIWVRESRANYDWLYQHLLALVNEFWYRYPDSTAEKTRLHLEVLRKAPRRLTGTTLTPIRLAMPDYLKALYSGPEAYRMYYSIHKRVQNDGSPFTWTRRPVPEWF